ncbi:MAG: O-antigen ligase family protein [Candidatus Omnitrophica bacterium]|nr:O-antigen ligase family protein [Candidatus Omnitrophota bacterium]
MRPEIVTISVLVFIGLVLGLLIAGLPTVITISVLGAAGLFLLAFFNPLPVMAVLLCAVPFNILWIGVGIAPLEVIYSSIFILLAASWALKRALYWESGPEKLYSPVAMPLLAFFFAAALAALIGISRGHAFAKWGSDLNAVMFYGLCFMAPDIIRDKKQLYKILLLMMASTAVALLSAGDLDKIKGAGVFALVMFIISIAMLDCLKDSGKKAFFLVLSVFFGIMQIMSFARSMWLSAIFGLAFLFLVSLERQKANFIKVVLGTALLTTLYLSLAMSVPSENPLYRSIYAVEKRYESIFTAKEEPSIITRESEWHEASRKALEHPIFGNGLGTEFTYFRYDQWFGAPAWITTRYIHNVYLFIFLNMGALGLLSFLWFAAAFLRYGLSVYRSQENAVDKALSLGILSSFAALMVVSLAGPFLTSPAVTMWFGFFTGALIIIDRRPENKSIDP